MGENVSLSRRGFIGTAGAAAAAGALGPLAGVAAADGGRGDDHDDRGFGRRGSIPTSRIGIQLFTVRDLLADNELDLPGTFEMLADAGYAQVEIGGTYDGRTAAQFRALADQYGLRPEGMHTVGVGDLWRSNRAQIFADAAALGLRYVGLAAPIFGVLQTPPNIVQTPQTHEAYKALAAEFNAWGAEARGLGLKFYYHNHPFDFALDEGTPIYDTLLAETDPRLVWFEMDIAWFEAGGQSAYDYLSANPWRYPLFHVKDLRFAADGPRVTPANVAKPNRPYWITDVGKGDIDFARIFSALRDPREHHYFVEHDDAPEDETPDATSPRPRNPAGSANTAWTSRKYLAGLEIRRRGRHD
jgi:sugar phosphate isomerase/epimerase